MTTSPKQISLFTEEQLTLSPEDFRANLTAKQVNDLERRMTAISAAHATNNSRGSAALGRGRKRSRVVNWNGGMVFDEVQADLEAEGYEFNRFLFQLVPKMTPSPRSNLDCCLRRLKYKWIQQHPETNLWKTGISGRRIKTGQIHGVVGNDSEFRHALDRKWGVRKVTIQELKGRVTLWK